MSNKIKRLDATGLTRILTNIYSEIASFSKKTISTAKDYVDTKISDLINGAPTTLDTLGEIAQAMSDNKDVVDALEEAIGTKATSSDLTAHTGNTSNPHSVTKTQVGLGNVENKSSATIRSELTKENVTTALGFTPPTTNTTYSNATQSAAGLESAADKTKLDGIAEGANNYSLPSASSTVRGGVKVGYTANDKNYPVQLSDEKMYVNVPWTDTNTTYSNFVKSGSGAKAGLVPAPSTTAGTTKYLREDGTWQVPPDNNTTYSAASTTANGLMSKEDKTKLDGIASEANKYILPTAGKDTLGGVKTTSTVTSTAGHTACPILNGIPYYKDTTYTNATTTTAGLMSSTDKVKLNGLTKNITLWASGQIPANESDILKPPKGYYYIVTLSTSNPPHSIWLVSMVIDYYSYNIITKLLGKESSPSVELAYPGHQTHPDSTGIIINGCSHSSTSYKIYQLPF